MSTSKTLVALLAAGLLAACESSLLEPGLLVNTTPAGTANIVGSGSSDLVLVVGSTTAAATTPVGVSVSATVAGTPVADGSAVQLTTSAGSFPDGLTTTSVRTTGGTALTTVTSPTPGQATITASYGGIVRTATVTFTTAPLR